jgi:hypothetical protein
MCKLPFDTWGNIFIGSREYNVEIFKRLFCLLHLPPFSHHHSVSPLNIREAVPVITLGFRTCVILFVFFPTCFPQGCQIDSVTVQLQQVRSRQATQDIRLGQSPTICVTFSIWLLFVRRRGMGSKQFTRK